MTNDTQWYPLLPADGAVEFPTMGDYTLRIVSRHDGNYECDVLGKDDQPMARWHLSPDIHIAICIRKTAAQAEADDLQYLDKLAAIMGLDKSR